MTKIVLQDTSSGYNLSKINSNFDVIEEFINDKVLSRDNPTGDANQMVQTLDMNGQRIINLPAPTTLNEPARVQDLLNASIGILPVLPASLINVTPGHTISSTNVQSALYELADDTTALTASLAAEVTARGTAVANEAATRNSADIAINSTLGTHTTQIAANTAAVGAFAGSLAAATHIASSVAQLRLVNHANFVYVRTLGYAQVNDGGSGFYWYNASDTTSADNGGSIIVDSSGGRWYLMNVGPTNFKQWGARGDGSTDDLATIQGAINNSPPGTRIILPRGSYRMSGTLTVYGGRSIEGASRDSDVSGGTCQFMFDLGVGVCIATDQIDSTAAVTLKNFTINRAAGSIPTSSIGLRVYGSDQQVVEDVNVHRHDTGVDVNQCLSAYLNRVNTWACTSSHISLTGCVEPHFNACRLGRNGNADVTCSQYVAINNGVDTVKFEGCQFNQSGATVTQCVKWFSYNNANGIFHFIDCHMEAWTTAVFVADGATVKVQRLKVNACSITINGSGAQLFNSAANIFQDGTFTGNNLDVSSALDSSVNMIFTGNNITGTFSYNSGKYAIVGNVFTSNVTLTGTSNHSTLTGNSILGTLTNSAGTVVAGNN